MKKFIYILMSFVLILGATSCSDLLEEESQTEIDKNKYMNNAQEAESVLLGVYRSMVTEGCYAYNLSLMFNISTDLAQCEGKSTERFRAIPTNYFNATNADIQRTWGDLYNGIYNANDFLEHIAKHIDNYSFEDQQLARIFIAEARALRGLFYFELLRWWGHIPLLTSTADSLKPAAEFTQAAPEEVFAFIEADLKHAVTVLPWAVDDKLRNDSSYRFSKGAAAGLLAKVYATWAGYPVQDASKWEEAAKMAKLVVDSGKHSLLPNFEDLWKNTCNGVWDARESLIEVSFYASAVTGTQALDPVSRIGKWNGVAATYIEGKRGSNAANVKVVYPFMRKWMKWQIDEKGGLYKDLRYQLSIADYRYTTEGKQKYTNKLPEEYPGMPEGASIDPDPWQKFTPAKWDTEKYILQGGLINNDKSNVNWYILRYADVLLLYAEAMNEWKGPSPEAVEALNRVRRRGFGLDAMAPSIEVDTPIGVSQDELRQIIRDERAYELCFEGQRRQDLTRWGIYVRTIRQTGQDVWSWFPESSATSLKGGHYTAAYYTHKNKNELLPIPQREIDLMTQCDQNTGWE